MSYELNVSSVASLIADPTRSAMLVALLDGRPLPAGELAYASGVTAQTASAHLARLLAGGLLAVEKEGRHRYYRLAGPHVAQALEHLAAINTEVPLRRKPLSPKARELRFARCCYDHLAGQLGVAVTQGMCSRGFIIAAPEKRFALTPSGIEWFASIGLNTEELKPTRRGLARQCLDWTERRRHLAGPLGVELLNVLCARGWLRRSKESRSVRITPEGHTELKRQLGVDGHSLRESQED